MLRIPAPGGADLATEPPGASTALSIHATAPVHNTVGAPTGHSLRQAELRHFEQHTRLHRGGGALTPSVLTIGALTGGRGPTTSAAPRPDAGPVCSSRETVHLLKLRPPCEAGWLFHSSNNPGATDVTRAGVVGTVLADSRAQQASQDGSPIP